MSVFCEAVLCPSPFLYVCCGLPAPHLEWFSPFLCALRAALSPIHRIPWCNVSPLFVCEHIQFTSLKANNPVALVDICNLAIYTMHDIRPLCLLIFSYFRNKGNKNLRHSARKFLNDSYILEIFTLASAEKISSFVASGHLAKYCR